MTDVLYICLTLLVTRRFVMKCSVCGGVHRPRGTCAGRGGGGTGGIERLGPGRAVGAPARPRPPRWLSSRWGRSQRRLHPGSTGVMLQQLLRPPGCLEELLGLGWLCLPLEPKMLPLPGPTPHSQPASLPVKGKAQRKCCPSHPQGLSSQIPGL